MKQTYSTLTIELYDVTLEGGYASSADPATGPESTGNTGDMNQGVL